MISACAYMRCSGKGQVEGDTWDRQHEAIATCATAKGFSLDYEFREPAVAGKTEADDRPAFQEMIGTLLGNGCKTIIVESLDRLAREYRIQEQLIIYIASKGLTLISANTGENITEAMMGDPMRRALVQIQGVLAELDKNMIVAKLRKARARKRANGERCEGAKPFGSLPSERDILGRIVRLRQDGFTPGAIARGLNAHGIPTRYGTLWYASTVSKILHRVPHETSL